MSTALKTKSPTLAEIREAIMTCGSDNEEVFGYPVLEDGLHLQQNPQEYSEFVHYMATQCKPSKLALEIGVASGGQTKFLRDWYRIEKTIVVDIGQHPRHHHWPRIKQLCNTEFVLELIEDSHSEKVRQALLPFAGQVDFAFVDGDHSYRGLKQDLILSKTVCKPGAIFVLHDTTAVKDCKKVYDEMLKSPDFKLLRNFSHRFGISVWEYLAVRGPKQSLLSLITGRLTV